MSDTHTNGFAENETVAFEHSDVDTRVILWFVAGLAVSLAAVMGVIWFGFLFLLRTENAEKKSGYQLAEQYRSSRPNVEDRLPEGTPRLEGMAVDQPGGHTIGRMYPSTARIMAEREEEILDSAGWAEPGKVARIPIQDAMKRLAKKGPEPKTDYQQMPNGTSSGRAPNGGPTS